MLVTTPFIYAIPPLKSASVSGLDGASYNKIILPYSALPSVGENVTVNSVAVSANNVLLAKTGEKTALSLTTLLIVVPTAPMLATTIVALAEVFG